MKKRCSGNLKNIYRNLSMIFVLSIIILSAGAGISLYIYFSKAKGGGYTGESIKMLQDKTELIYRETAVNFALYSENGERKLLVINGEKKNNDSESGGILCNNLFENPVFTPQTAETLEKEGAAICDIDTFSNPYTTLDSGKKAIYNITIKKTDNKKYKYITIVKDITSSVENKAEKERFEKLIDFATKRSMVGIAHYNITTRKGKATDSWYDNLCEKKEDIIRTRGHRVSPEIREKVLNYLGSLKHGNRDSFSIDFELHTPTGIKWIREYIFIYRIKDKDNIEVIDINFDVTDLKESENTLIVLNRQVMEAKKESDKFLSNISHEIRTPLNSVIGFSGLYVNTEDRLERKNFEEIIRMNINKLIELVNNVILISKIDSHSIKTVKETIRINKMITLLQKETKQMLREDKSYTGKEILINCDIPDVEHTINTDRKMLYQIFTNLLSNAMKFTDKGNITIGYRKKEDIYNFYVQDTGIGIEKKYMDKLFERFEKADTFTQGTGLGLPLCKSILNNLGGEIYVESEPGKGSEFSFTLKSL